MIDVNKPVTNPELIAAINAMRENYAKENQDRVFIEVLKAHFVSPAVITPTPESSEDGGKVVLKEGTQISFNLIENTANQKYFLAFTDWDELKKWSTNENQQTLILTFDDFAAMVLDENSDASGFVINPFGGNLIFDKNLIMALKEEKERRASGGATEQVVEKDTPMQLGQPSEYPEELVKAIIEHLKKQKNIKAAYLQLMTKGEEQSYLLVVDFEGDRKETFNKIAYAAKQYLKGMYIDMVPYDSDFGRDAAKNVEPFYKRKKFGLF